MPIELDPIAIPKISYMLAYTGVLGTKSRPYEQVLVADEIQRRDETVTERC